MRFIEILLSNSNLKQAKLVNAAKKAMVEPSTGVKIINPAASQVIKDCAAISVNYLPLLVFGHYDNPFERLAQKFTKADIHEFIEAAKKNISYHHLLLVILGEIERKMPHAKQDVISITNAASVPSANNIDDPYGDYYAPFTETETQSKTVEDILCDAFCCAS